MFMKNDAKNIKDGHTQKRWRHMNRWEYEVASCLFSVMEITWPVMLLSCVQFLLLGAKIGDEAIPVSIFPTLKSFSFKLSTLLSSQLKTICLRGETDFWAAQKWSSPVWPYSSLYTNLWPCKYCPIFILIPPKRHFTASLNKLTMM